MRQHHVRISPALLQSRLCSELKSLVPWTAVGCSLSVDALLRLLWLMACLRSSFHAVMDRVGFECSENTARLGVRRQLPNLAELATRLSARLVEMFGPQPADGFHIAIDTHFSPYYGDGSTIGVVRGQLKASTRKFFVYATACVVERGRRYTLAVTAVESGRPIDALEPLLRQMAADGVKIRSILMDKGFFAAAVFARLNRARIPYVVAVPHNRAALKRFFRDRAGKSADYRMGSRSGAKEKVAVTLRLRRVQYRRDGKQRTEVYAVNRMGRMSDDGLREHYRRRFGIETSYRQMREMKTPTTSRDRVWRMLLIGLALMFRQLWALLDGARVEAKPEQQVKRVTQRKIAWLIAQELIATQNATTAAAGDNVKANG